MALLKKVDNPVVLTQSLMKVYSLTTDKTVAASEMTIGVAIVHTVQLQYTTNYLVCTNINVECSHESRGSFGGWGQEFLTFEDKK